MWKISFIIRITNTFDERFKAIPVPFFISDFTLLSCELDNFTFKRCIESLKQNKITALPQFLEENLKWFFLLLQ